MHAVKRLGVELRDKPQDRLAWLGRAVVVALISGLLLSPLLWVSDRDYPLVPLLDFVPSPSPADRLLLGLLAALLVVAAVARTKLAGACALAAVALVALLVLQDQSRLQPWVYQYSFMLAAVGIAGLGRIGPGTTLDACRLIVAGTYFWSGLQKANASFAANVYPSLVEPLGGWLPSWAQTALLSGAYSVPALEAAIGVGLLFRRTRTLAVAGAVATHAFILLCIGPLGIDQNTVVWPWNVAMAVFVPILFWRPPDEPSAAGILSPRNSVFRAVVLAFFALAPLFNFFGLWDSYLSSSLYSGNTKDGYVLVRDGSVYTSTNIVILSLRELNVPAYPEERVFQSVFADRWCEDAGDSDPVLLIEGTPGILSGERPSATYRCEDVRPISQRQPGRGRSSAAASPEPQPYSSRKSRVEIFALTARGRELDSKRPGTQRAQAALYTVPRSPRCHDR